VAWAEHEFHLNVPDDNGITQREHLEQVEKQIGHPPKELVNPYDPPSLLMHVWSAFCNLSLARTAGLNGPNPITYQEIESWMRLTGTPLEPYEIEMVKRLDGVFIKVNNGNS